MKQDLCRSHFTLGLTLFSNQKAVHSGTFPNLSDEYAAYSGDRLVSPSDKPHVLVVDDNAIVLKTLAAMFRKIGYRVCTAYGSAKALLYVGKTPYDLVFSELEMQVLDGYNLARIIKKHSTYTKVIIMTTGHSQTELSALMNGTGVDGWLFKPFCIKDLDAMLVSIGLPSKSNTK